MNHLSTDRYQPGNLFALRTPLLPFHAIEHWSRDLYANAAPEHADWESALATDRQRLRTRLQCLVEEPVIREALFLASPSLEAGLKAWQRDPESKKGQRAEQALVRYLYRMTARSTPFGLFSGCSVGRVGDTSRLRLSAHETYRRHTRLDMDYLSALCDDLRRHPPLRRRLYYRPNSSLYRAAGRLRYVESRLVDRTRHYQLVAVGADDHLLAVLNDAATGASFSDLAANLAGREGVSVTEAEAFIDELIDSEILMADLSPPVTGPEPIHDLVRQLRAHPESRQTADCLEQVTAQLTALDQDALGSPTTVYRDVASTLSSLPTAVEMARLLQVDLVKPAPDATIGPEVIHEITRGLELLRRLARTPVETSLERFCKAFTTRYDGRQRVPLVEVLDEEIGLGFDDGTTAEPLLEGLSLTPPEVRQQALWDAKERMLLDKLLAARAANLRTIEITEDDLTSFPATDAPTLPGAFQVMATVAAGSPRALAAGDLRVFLRYIGGPSGASLLGRFCHADDALRQGVEEHLRAEEAQDPEALFAELVHLPQGRIGNVLLRPLLRDHEIPFLGRSGAPPERQIPITDLLVSVDGHRVTLHSRHLGKRIVPRLTSAHNFEHNALGVYRFLASLQHQEVLPRLSWQWGAFTSADFLPRVTSGRLVLARARWRVPREEIAALCEPKANERFRQVQTWRAKRGLPRWIVLIDGDNELPVDLDNVLSVEAFLSLVRPREQLDVTEMFPLPEDLCAHGPEGRFAHELVIPFIQGQNERALEEATAADGAALALAAAPATIPEGPALAGPSLGATAPAALVETFLPGSGWLYAKLYAGPSTLDEILTEVIGPLVREAKTRGAIDAWFFLRFADPQWHLRIRFQGQPHRLTGEVLPRLHQAMEPLLADGRLWQLQLDTYDREVDRYGGPTGIQLAEKLFTVDSETVLEILEGLVDDGPAEDRWLLAARGMDQMLDDLGWSLDRKLAWVAHRQMLSARELNVGPPLRRQLAERLRRERRRLEQALAPTLPADHPLSFGARALDRRSERLAPIVIELTDAARGGLLTTSLTELAASYVHMFANRLLRTEGRMHEMVLHDFWHQHLRSQQARQASRAPVATRGPVGPGTAPTSAPEKQVACAAGGYR